MALGVICFLRSIAFVITLNGLVSAEFERNPPTSGGKRRSARSRRSRRVLARSESECTEERTAAIEWWRELLTSARWRGAERPRGRQQHCAPLRINIVVSRSVRVTARCGATYGAR